MLCGTHDQKTLNLFHYCREHIPNFQIEEKMQKALCFRERLEVFHKDNLSGKLESIGKYIISVESIGPRSKELFVQIFLSMKVNGRLVVSKITSSATKDLHCLEEKKYEFSEKNNSFLERILYLGNGDNNGYFVKATEKSAERNQSKATSIAHNDIMLMSDGCSILLMRYLAMTDFCGSLSFDFITIEGNIVKCDYQCSNADTSVFTIVQTFHINNTVTSTIKTILSKQGNIISINLIDSPCIIKINPHFDSSVQQQQPIILPLREKWKEDFELISKHYDKKILEECRKANYLLLHSEINELLSDYIQSLLCKKPEDVLKFSIDHFQILTINEN